jgi:deoxyribodipyrimidine photolyase
MPKLTTLFVLTRDFRTEDALTLYAAYDEAKASNTNLSIAFRFHPDQIIPKNNPYYCPNAVQFMIQSLEKLSDRLPFQWIDAIPDTEWKNYLTDIRLHKIFIARDFTPFARQRYEFYNSIVETIEIDDITVFPIETMKPYVKLGPFIDFVETLSFPNTEERNIDWKKEVDPLPNKKFVHSGKIQIKYEINDNILVHPDQINQLEKDLGQNIKGYAEKKVREKVGDPKVSYLSAFIKFGLISIRKVHKLSKNTSGPSSADKKAFHRELYFRDFYYTLAWYKPDEVYLKPEVQQKNPKFISETDLMDWKKEKGIHATVSQKERKDIEEAKNVFQKWIKAETEYPLINAGITQLTETGYMLNRLRMLTTSYLTRDNGLWWKYPEQFFALHLTDYDWTINCMNHQNIAKVGLYPKYTLDFSIKRQQGMNPKDKQKYMDHMLRREELDDE